MANYFSLRDGLITNSNTFGISMSGAEKTSNTSAYTLNTTDSWSTLLSGSSADVIDSIAVHLSSRATNPVGVLSAEISQYGGSLTKTGTTLSVDTPFTNQDASVSFNGSSYITIPAGSNINLGSGDFTIEMWVKTTIFSLEGGSGRSLFGFGTSAANKLAITFRSSSGATSKVSVFSNAYLITGTIDVADGNWNHVCLLRTGTSLRLYINGTQSGSSATNSVNYNAGATLPMYIGTFDTGAGRYDGLISNFRIVVGTAIIPSPVPTSPLSAINNTTLLYQNPYINGYKNSNGNLNSLAGTYPISSFTSYDGENLIKSYPINWQLLKLSNTFTNNSRFFSINLKTSNTDQLKLMGSNTNNGLDYDIMCIRDSFISSPPINLHIGNIINGFTTENRTITANTISLNNLLIHKGGSLVFSDTSTTLSVSGSEGLQITNEGTLKIGNSANPVPKNTTHQIVLSSNIIGVGNGGRLDVYGAYKVPYTRLTAPSNAGDGAFRVTDSVSGNWNVGDTLVFSPNTTNPSSYDERTILDFAGHNWFNNTAANTFAHTVLDYVPNIANLSRNIKIGGTSNTAKGTIASLDNTNVNINNTEFKFINNCLVTGINNNGLFTLSGCTLSGSGVENLLSPKPPGSIFSSVFNGTNSYIYYPSNYSDLDINAGTNFTLECFVKINSYKSFNPIFAFNRNSPADASNYAFSLALGSSQIRFSMYPGPSTISTSSNIIQLNKWHHIAVVAISSTIYIYLDGELQTSGSQITWNYASNFVPKIGIYPNVGIADDYFGGKISNLRFVTGLAVYTQNFNPPVYPLSAITDTGVTTPILTLQSNPPVDSSYLNSSLTVNTLTYEIDSPFKSNLINSNILNCISYKPKYGILLDDTNSINSTISDNLLLSSKDAGIYIDNGLNGIILDNNICIGPSIYGSYLKDNISNGTISGVTNYNNTYGMYVSGNHIGVINDIINTYSVSAGVYVDGNITNLSSTIFSNITASNNKTIGFLVSGNTINHLTPITLNINGLVANDNLSAGFEGYCISGNLSSLELNRNGFYGIKTSIGNAPTIIDSITALMNNVSYTSAAIGILSAINYHPTIIKNANVGKSVAASTFGAAISLDSTKFSQFVVMNSTVSGGSTDFQLRTTRGQLEGSYLISNTNTGNLPVGAGITTSNYQSDVFKSTGFAFTNMNNASGYNVTYLAAGTRQIDSTINISQATSPSERLTPRSTNIKLRSGSKFVALDAGQSTSIGVYVRKSTVTTDGVAYNGTAPRLILKRNSYMGINSDIVMDQLDTTSENFLKLSGVTPAVTDSGVLEFYIDCDGTQGWINIDNWTAN